MIDQDGGVKPNPAVFSKSLPFQVPFDLLYFGPIVPRRTSLGKTICPFLSGLTVLATAMPNHLGQTSGQAMKDTEPPDEGCLRLLEAAYRSRLAR